jgi:hypothetical protein
LRPVDSAAAAAEHGGDDKSLDEDDDMKIKIKDKNDLLVHLEVAVVVLRCC